MLDRVQKYIPLHGDALLVDTKAHQAWHSPLGMCSLCE